MSEEPTEQEIKAAERWVEIQGGVNGVNFSSGTAPIEILTLSRLVFFQAKRIEELEAENLRLKAACADKDAALKKPCGCNRLHDSMLLGRELACHQVKALTSDGSAILKRLEAADRLYKTAASFAEDIQEDCDCLDKVLHKNFIEGLEAYEASQENGK